MQLIIPENQNKINIFGFKKNRLEEICLKEGFSRYTADQLCDWMYKKRITDFNLMSNIALESRRILSEKYIISPLFPVSHFISKDKTKKYLFAVSEMNFIETVYIPEKKRATLCISVQTGCVLGCKFCMTGKRKKSKNLRPGEIITQFLFIPEYERITNIVIMGMGEPLLNWTNVKDAIELLTSKQYVGMSKKRITLSTIGIIPQLQDFLKTFPCELAISLNTPFPAQRKIIMPAENRFPIKKILNIIREHTAGTSRKVTFEYVVFKDFNHTYEHAVKLSEILKNIPCKINLIRYNTIENCELKSPENTEIEHFQKILIKKGLKVTKRKTRGEDIKAACGMLGI